MNNRRIVILGFMACGKTTVGQELAQRLNCNFVDLDSFITQRHRRSPAQIIQQDGEDSFRELETLALRDVLQDPDAGVIALGGGAWTIAPNRTLVALHDCFTVWLDVPFEVCWQRIQAGPTNRPLAPDRTSALARYDSRRADYALAEHQVRVTKADTPDTLADHILSQT